MFNKLRINQDLYELVINGIIEYIKEVYEEGDEIPDCDLYEIVNNLYNNDFYIIGIREAGEFLLEYRDEAVEADEYYRGEFGEGLIFGEEEKNVNKLLLYIGEQIMSLVLEEEHKPVYTKENLIRVINKLI